MAKPQLFFSLPSASLQWSHNERNYISNHQPHDCLLNHLFKAQLKETSKLRVNGLCEGNSLVTCEFPAQRASNVENVSIWCRHHDVDSHEWWPTLMISWDKIRKFCWAGLWWCGIEEVPTSCVICSNNYSLWSNILATMTMVTTYFLPITSSGYCVWFTGMKHSSHKTDVQFSGVWYWLPPLSVECLTLSTDY